MIEVFLKMIWKVLEILRQLARNAKFGRKLLTLNRILNRMTALSRFAEPFQNLSNHFKSEVVNS